MSVQRGQVVGVAAVMAAVFGFVAAASAEGPIHPRQQQQQQGVEKTKKKAKRPRLDVVFAIDATGSMSDEIEVIKQEVWGIANRLASGKPTPDIRFGLVLYKDRGDDFVARSTGLTRDLDKIHGLITSISVDGGGDNPEHVGRGLHEALSLNWDGGRGVGRMIYLVGDAPGHTGYDDGHGIDAALARAKKAGITIHAIGCSGIDGDGGRTQFASIASATRGRFQPLTYHAVIEDEDGAKQSVVSFDGEVYEAEGVLGEEEWREGGAKLLKGKRLKRASPRARSSASRAERKNNLDAVVVDSVADEAASQGVVY